jgi:hypothetical protein
LVCLKSHSRAVACEIVLCRASLVDPRAQRWQHRNRDITSLSERGRLLFDYTKFHEVDPEEV